MNKNQSSPARIIESILTFLMLIGFGFTIGMAGYFFDLSINIAVGKAKAITFGFGDFAIFPLALTILFLISVLILAYSDKRLFPHPPHGKYLRYLAFSTGMVFSFYSIIGTYLLIRFLAYYLPDPEGGYPFVSLPIAAIITFVGSGYFLLRLHFKKEMFYASVFAFFSIAMSFLVFLYIKIYMIPFFEMYNIHLLFQGCRIFAWAGLPASFILFLILVAKSRQNASLSRMALLTLGMWVCSFIFVFVFVAIEPLRPFWSFADEDHFSSESPLIAFIVLWILILALQRIKYNRIRRREKEKAS